MKGQGNCNRDFIQVVAPGFRGGMILDSAVADPGRLYGTGRLPGGVPSTRGRVAADFSRRESDTRLAITVIIALRDRQMADQGLFE